MNTKKKLITLVSILATVISLGLIGAGSANAVMPHTVMPHIEAPAQHWYDTPAVAGGYTTGTKHYNFQCTGPTNGVIYTGGLDVVQKANASTNKVWAGSTTMSWDTNPNVHMDRVVFQLRNGSGEIASLGAVGFVGTTNTVPYSGSATATADSDAIAWTSPYYRMGVYDNASGNFYCYSSRDAT